jgi:hypothetical protein
MFADFFSEVKSTKYNNTYNGVLDLRIHEEDPVLVGYHVALLPREYIRYRFGRAGRADPQLLLLLLLLGWGEVAGNERLAHGHHHPTLSATLRLHHTLQLLNKE